MGRRQPQARRVGRETHSPRVNLPHAVAPVRRAVPADWHRLVPQRTPRPPDRIPRRQRHRIPKPPRTRTRPVPRRRSHEQLPPSTDSRPRPRRARCPSYLRATAIIPYLLTMAKPWRPAVLGKKSCTVAIGRRRLYTMSLAASEPGGFGDRRCVDGAFSSRGRAGDSGRVL